MTTILLRCMYHQNRNDDIKKECVCVFVCVYSFEDYLYYKTGIQSILPTWQIYFWLF